MNIRISLLSFKDIFQLELEYYRTCRFGEKGKCFCICIEYFFTYLNPLLCLLREHIYFLQKVRMYFLTELIPKYVIILLIMRLMPYFLLYFLVGYCS